MWLTDIFLGAVSSGVNKPTVVALNASLIGCILCLVVLLFISLQTAPYLAIHIGFILIIAVALLILVNWLLTQIGLVKAEDQRREIFPITEEQINDDPDKVVQDAFAWAQARADFADNPQLAAELKVEAAEIQAQADKEKSALCKKGN